MAFVERPPAPGPPEEEPALKPWQVGLVEYDQDRLRQAYVGDKYDKFAELFERFEDEDGFRLSFIWPPLVFGCFWFLYRRMYRWGILFLVLGYGLRRALSLPPLGDWLVWLSFNAALALSGAWLYFKTTERRIEKALFEFGNDPPLVASWLSRHGGVNDHIVVLGIVFILLRLYFTFLVTLGMVLGGRL